MDYMIHVYIFSVLAILINWLLVVRLSRLLSLPKCWKLVPHSTLYHNHIVSVIVMLVFIDMLCSFSFGSVVLYVVYCSLYFFMFNVTLLSHLPVFSTSFSASSVILSGCFVYLYYFHIMIYSCWYCISSVSSVNSVVLYRERLYVYFWWSYWKTNMELLAKLLYIDMWF